MRVLHQRIDRDVAVRAARCDDRELAREWHEPFEDQRDFAERVRHNRAAEAVAAGGLAVRLGSLGLARQRVGRIAAGGGEDGYNSDLNYLMGD